MASSKEEVTTPVADSAEPSRDGMRGIAPIKSDYIVYVKGKVINWDYVPDEHKTEYEGGDGTDQAGGGDGTKTKRIDDRDLNPDKRFKLKGQNKNKLRYKIGKKVSWSKNKRDDGPETGGNEENTRTQVDKSERLCLRYIDHEGRCVYGETCDYCHDLYKIYKLNEPDLLDNPENPCFIYSTYGRCQFGTACRFSNSHTQVIEDKKIAFNLINHKSWSLNGGKDAFTNRFENRLDLNVQHKLRKKTYDFKIVTDGMNKLYRADIEGRSNKNSEDIEEEAIIDETLSTTTNASNDRRTIGAAIVDEFLAGRDFGRKKVDFKDKLILAPLTTVGNLPFRRLCKKFSCDITIAEMSLCSSLLNGNPSEWSHLKRHESEDVFGVQITGTHPEMVTKICKVIGDNCELDFLDFNCGCPTEWIYQSGAGAGLMNRPSKLRKMIAGAAMVTKVPITIKMRSGCTEDRNIAHNLVNSVIKPFTSKYIGAITIHGRSRNQRYTKLADWSYINQCARFAGDIPVIGSGDCISWQDYYENLQKYESISGVMLARGALISPWLFTEIKERRTWDISSRERLDIVKDFANYALDHWGSDATGVENSRRYLLEWLSFACRYIPVGLLEVLPQKINERPPKYRGRDELETLLSSPAASDWVKISEMFLGKVPDNFKFLPKHKANAYESVVEG